MSVRQCPSCRKLSPAKLYNCEHCGASLSGTMPFDPADVRPVARPAPAAPVEEDMPDRGGVAVAAPAADDPAPPENARAREANRLGFWVGLGLSVIGAGSTIVGFAMSWLWMGWAYNLLAFLVVVIIAVSSERFGMKFLIGAFKGFLVVLLLAMLGGVLFALAFEVS